MAPHLAIILSLRSSKSPVPSRSRRHAKTLPSLNPWTYLTTSKTSCPHSLYNNPDQPLPPQVVDVLYDTGAAISMLPEEYTYAWTNLRECLHTLTGCFAGSQESNLQIGEFHGIITLDSGETRSLSVFKYHPVLLLLTYSQIARSC